MIPPHLCILSAQPRVELLDQLLGFIGLLRLAQPLDAHILLAVDVGEMAPCVLHESLIDRGLCPPHLGIRLLHMDDGRIRVELLAEGKGDDASA